MVRPGHPLHGLDLLVWGRLRLRGVAMVVLVLPDGSKERIPAAWVGENLAAPVVAAAADLLRLLRVISGLLPDQVPAPLSQLASQLPSPVAQAVVAIVARLIIQAARPGSPAGAATPVPAPAGASQQGLSGGE